MLRSQSLGRLHRADAWRSSPSPVAPSVPQDGRLGRSDRRAGRRRLPVADERLALLLQPLGLRGARQQQQPGLRRHVEGR